VSVGALWLLLGTHLCSRHCSHGLRQVRPSASDFVTDLKSDLRQVQFFRGLRRSSQDLTWLLWVEFEYTAACHELTHVSRYFINVECVLKFLLNSCPLCPLELSWVEYKNFYDESSWVHYRDVLKYSTQVLKDTPVSSSSFIFLLCQSGRWSAQFLFQVYTGNLVKTWYWSKRLIKAQILFSIAWSEPHRMSDSSCARQRARSSICIVSETLRHYFLSNVIGSLLPQSPSWVLVESTSRVGKSVGSVFFSIFIEGDWSKFRSWFVSRRFLESRSHCKTHRVKARRTARNKRWEQSLSIPLALVGFDFYRRE
jgi:hypothetical protein